MISVRNCNKNCPARNGRRNVQIQIYLLSYVHTDNICVYLYPTATIAAWWTKWHKRGGKHMIRICLVTRLVILKILKFFLNKLALNINF